MMRHVESNIFLKRERKGGRGVSVSTVPLLSED